MCGVPINRVVFLDDDPNVSIMYKSFLKNICPGDGQCCGGICDYCCKFYTDIDLFMKELKKTDIVVLDYILGSIRNGLDVAKMIRDLFGSNIFIILYSSFVDNNTMIESERLNYVDSVITKPDFDKLIKLIEEREKEYGFSL